MNSRIHRVGLLLVACLIALPAAAGDMVPFRALIDTEPVIVGSCGPGCLLLEIGGTGQATHMGRTDFEGPSEVQINLSDPSSGTQTGTSTLTAANGDTIVIAFAGTVEFEGPSPTDPVSFQGTWEVIAGGTGRFEGGTGSGTYRGTAAGPAGILLLAGTVSSPGTNK